MYLEYYHLKEKPFQINMDPKFIWLGESHKEALAVFKFGVLDNSGDLVVTGDAGSGKSTLIRELIKRFDRNTIVAKLDHPVMEKQDIMEWLANELHMGITFSKKGDFLIHFSRFLNKSCSENKKVVLIIDNAHQLSPQMLKQVRRLSNIKRQNTQLLKIVFVGRNEFADIISKRKNRILQQKITINYTINPLKGSEICQYISHRLQTAGSIKNIFTARAIGEIRSFSKGYPRLINIMCDHALMMGYMKGVDRINAEIVKECIDQLHRRDEKIDNDEKASEALDGIRHKIVKMPWTKPSQRKVIFAVFSMLALIIFLYHPVKFGNSVYKMETYFKKRPNRQSGSGSTDTPTMKESNQIEKPDTPDTQNPSKRVSGGASKKSNRVRLTPAIYMLNEQKPVDYKPTAPMSFEKAEVNRVKGGVQQGTYIVYLHYTNLNNKELMEKLSVYLKNNGFKIPGIEKVSYQNQDIRYFHDEDKAGALLLKKRLTQFTSLFTHGKDIKIKTINLSHKYPNAQKGALELWLNI